MPDRQVGKFYVYNHHEHRWRDIRPEEPNGSGNDVLPLTTLANKVVNNPACFGQLMASMDVWYFFAVPEELDDCDGAELERLALMRHIRLLESVKAHLARRMPRARAHGCT